MEKRITIAQALAEYRAADPGGLEDEQAVRWLARLDGRVFREVMANRRDCPEIFVFYNADTDRSTKMLIPEPHGAVYTHWLCAQNALLRGENDRYLDTMAAFQAEWDSFAADWIQSHPTVRQGMRIRF